jgi:serine/threonine protein kinase
VNVLKRIIFSLLIVFVGIQFIPANRNQSTEILESDFTKSFEVPQEIQTLLKTSCYDCHSNNTSYPWYNKIQPASWFLEKHIKEGKEELNFSEFGANSKRKQRSKLKSIMSQIRDDEMPMLSYTLIHGDAKLSNSEKEQIINWVTKLRDSL